MIIRLKDFIYLQLKRLFFFLGYDLQKLNTKIGQDPFKDISFLLKDKSDLVVFDVGANTGQSITEIQNTFKSPRIHAFEPSLKAFNELSTNFKDNLSPFLKLNNFGLSAKTGEIDFYENTNSDMSSFLAPGKKIGAALNKHLKRKLKHSIITAPNKTLKKLTC